MILDARVVRSWQADEDAVRLVAHEIVELNGLQHQPPWTRAEARAWVWDAHQTLQARWHVKELTREFSVTLAFFAAEMCKTPKQLRKAGYGRSVILQ